MRAIVVMVAFAAFSAAAAAAAATPSSELIAALIQVESGGDPTAVGDGGKALGILQIHEDCWKDGCRFLGVSWDYKTGALDPGKSRAVCVAYLSGYGEAYRKATGKGPTGEIFARIWNGGPDGWRKKATLAYWAKVRAKLKAATTNKAASSRGRKRPFHLF